jgi:membrane-bound lytic murein transglycosylase MltF
LEPQVLKFKEFFCLFFLMILGSGVGLAQDWGMLCTPKTVVNIRADRTKGAWILGKIIPGEIIKVDYLENNWYAVFPADATTRDAASSLGYVYAPLLKPASNGGKPVLPADDETSFEPIDKELDGSCSMENDFDLITLKNLLPQLSRISEAHTGDLPDMLERKTIRVLTTYSMSNYFILEGQSFGFEYSMLKDYEAFLNHGRSRQELRIVVEFVPVPSNQLIPSLVNGLGDIVAAGLPVTKEELQHVDFTAPYLSGIQEILVAHRNTGEIKSLQDLAGRQIYVRPISSYYKGLGRLNADLVSMDLQPLRIIKASAFLTTEDILELTNAGIIDLSVAESHLAELWSGLLTDIKIYDQITLGHKNSIAWMVRKNNPQLKASLNKFIKGHKKGTLHGNLYFNRYFKNTRWIKNPLTVDHQAKFSRYVSLFKKYGAKYGFDWRLIAAQAYQESGLDHKSRSPAGAIGLMQVLPSTARDERVGIDNLHVLENNVHAGIKYLAWIRQTYFNEDSMNPDARVRYALAAYNAGPSQIFRSRKLAAKMGYDPNLWFGHGELATLKVVGQEPVRYVSNINKYYLAYSLSETLDCLKKRHKETLKMASLGHTQYQPE